MKLAELSHLLAMEGQGSYTVYAPVNEAFEELSTSFLEELMLDPANLRLVSAHSSQ